MKKQLLSIGICLTLCAIACASVIADEEGWTMTVDSVTVTSGDTGISIPVYGEWDEEVSEYTFRLIFNPDKIQIVDMNADGCVGEDGTLYPSWIGDNQIRFYIEMDEEDEIPTGSGQLANLIINVNEGAWGETEITFYQSNSWNFYKDGDGTTHYPYKYDGTINIIIDNYPPATPETPDGPDTGLRNRKYYFTTQNVEDTEGDDIYYKFDWDDGEDSGWMGPFNSGENIEVKAWHKWKEAGDYEVTVTAKDENGEGLPSESHTMHIQLLEIGGVSGGFGTVTASITNAAQYSKDIDWEIEVSGGYFGFHIVDRASGGILPLAPEETASVSTTGGPLLGLGPIKIRVSAECAGESIVQTFDGFILFFFISA